jgi:hypothetical protein
MTPAADHRQKKLCHPGANDLGNRLDLVSDMGMFFLSKPDMGATDIFPKDMPDKICANFTCKGQECTHENCSFGHPKNTRELKPNTIAAIVQHFKTKKLDGSMNGTGAMPILLTKPKLSWEAKMALTPVRRLDLF